MLAESPVNPMPAKREIPTEVRALLAPLVAWISDEITERLGPLPTSHGVPDWLPARTCGLRPTTVRRLIKSGAVRAGRVGRETWVLRADVTRFIESCCAAQRREGDELERALDRPRKVK